MPIYIFKCPKCNYQSEELIMPGEDKQPGQCPKCKKAKMEIKPGAVALKGSSDCAACPASSCEGCFK